MSLLIESIHVLTATLSKQNSLTTALANHQHRSEHSTIQAICYGVLRYYFRLEAILQQLLKHSLRDKDQDIHILLLISLYQLLDMHIADYAAVNEAVNAAKKLKKPWAANLINGVLRNFLRNKDALLININKNEVAFYAHPRWLIKLLKNAWPNDWQAILTANNDHPPMFLRINQLKTSQSEYLAQLAQINMHAAPLALTQHGIRLEKPQSVLKLPGFKDGMVSVQDGAAQLAAELLELQPDQIVLDACAAPGGKTCHILETQPDLKNLIALEIEQTRVPKIIENLQRLDFYSAKYQQKINIICGDASTPTAWWNQTLFDRILIDAPCSGTGVIRRHPDIKLLREATDIPQYPVQQLKMLTALWPTLKKGGILLYATCSVLPQENNDVIKKFISQHADAEHLPINATWGIAQVFGRQIFPSNDGIDGFYYAKILKK